MSKSEALTDYLYQVAAHAKAEGREDVSRWIMSHMAREERAAKPKRKRKVRLAHGDRLVSGGSFWIPPALLREAKEDGDE